MHRESPSQTAGPYVHIGCTPRHAGLAGETPDLGASVKRGRVQGTEITLSGTLFDGDGVPVCDGLIEIWQPDAQGRFVGDPAADPQFTGFGRCATDAETGFYQFETVMPGAVTSQDGTRHAPFVTMWIAARGINVGLHTRVYFQEGADPVLDALGDDPRRQTLIATPNGPDRFQFDIHLQGPHETIFFDI